MRGSGNDKSDDPIPDAGSDEEIDDIGKYGSVLHTFPFYYVAIDSHYNLNFMNQSLLDTLGYTLDEVLG